MFQGSAPGPLLGEADLVIAFETDVPWLPSKEKLLDQQIGFYYLWK